MEFTPVEPSAKWYRSQGTFEYDGTTVHWSASIFPTTADQPETRWRPGVDFRLGLTATLAVKPPDYGHYATVEQAAAWIEEVVACHSYGYILGLALAETTMQTARYNQRLPQMEDTPDESQ